MAADIETALRRAIAFLKKREYAAAQMQTKLQKHHPPEVAKAAIAQLQKQGLLSDTRFARGYVRNKRENFGAARIAEELENFGIDESIAAEAMAAELTDDDQTRAAAVLDKKYPQPATDTKTLASMARFLTARGFDAEAINKALRTKTSADIKEEWLE